MFRTLLNFNRSMMSATMRPMKGATLACIIADFNVALFQSTHP